MNKSIYLFELDSIYKSDYQIEVGQKRLFEETLFHGNCVVLSYNQLTDSVVFLSAIYNSHTYEKMVDLFKLGVLKVSPYNSIRTPSQYVQGCIQRCLDDNAETFLFSGIPLDLNEDNKPLLKKLKNALRFSDIGILEEELVSNKNPKNIEFLIRYIRMILILSVENLAKTKSNKSKILSFGEIIDIVLNQYENFDKYLSITLDKNLFFEAIKNLNKIQEYLIKHAIGLNSRSNWIAVHQDNKECVDIDDKTWGLCEIIINLCYNYTVEQSIDSIYMAYDSIGDEKFFIDFKTRLEKNWQDFNNGHYTCYQPIRSTEYDYASIPLPRWSTAHRILSKIQHYRTFDNSTNLTEQQVWNRKLIRYFLTAILTTMAYIGVFILAEHLVDFTKEFLSKYFDVIFDKISDMKTLSKFINAIFTTILFGIFGSLIAKVFKMPDILEGIRDIFITFYDLKIILDYYFNHKI